MARHYPLGFLAEEVAFVVKRENAAFATQAALLRMAISTTPNMAVKPESTKKANRDFQKLINSMIESESDG